MQQKKIVHFLLSCLLFCSCDCLLANSTIDTKIIHESKASNLKPYLLPKKHRLRGHLKKLFQNKKMFRSATHFEKEGFRVQFGHKRLMVGSHPKIKGYLFKKFPDSCPKKEQLKNYIKRIRGANKVRKFIKERQLTHLVVPKKWLYKLPHYGYILIVEKMHIFKDKKNAKKYYHIDRNVLKELCIALHGLGGCDAYPRNQPFTYSGKIAFVDTEHVGDKRMGFFNHIMPALNKDNQSYASVLWKHLEEGIDLSHVRVK